MGHIARVLVQDRHGRDQLSNEAQRRIDIELQLFLVRDAKNVRQPSALDMIRHDRERGGRRHRAIDAADASVVCVPEVRETGGSLTERELKRRDGGQCRPQPQDLQQLACGTVSRDDACTETVGKKRRFRSIVRRKTGHGNGTQCNDKTNAPILKKGRKSLSARHSRPLRVA